MKFLRLRALDSLLPLLLTGLALFAGPVAVLSDNLGWHDQQRIVQIVLLAVAGLGALTLWRHDVSACAARVPRWVRRSLAGAFGLGLVSAFTAAYPRFAALEWATFWLLASLAMLLAMHASKAKTLFDVWAYRVVAAVAAMIALKVMVAYVVAMFVVRPLDTTRLFDGVFANRRFFGQVASMVVPLLAFPLLRGGLSKAAHVALFGLLTVWWMLVIASGTRGTWVALVLASGVLAVFAWRASRGWIRLQLMALAGGASLFAIFFIWLPGQLALHASIENRLANISTLSARDELWAVAWTQVQAHPWLGVGPMHLAAIPMTHGAHPHNSVLQLAAEWGVPAAIALLVPALIGVLRLLRKLREEASPDILLVCLAASLLAAAAQSMVDGVIVIPYTQTWLALVAGWALGVYFRNVGQTVVANDSHTGISLLSIFALAALLNGIFPDVFHRDEATRAFLKEGHPMVTPRYWFVGRIP